MRLSQYVLAVVMGLVGLVPLTATADEETVELKDCLPRFDKPPTKTSPRRSGSEATKHTDDDETAMN